MFNHNRRLYFGLLFSLLLIGSACEWKPPRRPIKKEHPSKETLSSGRHTLTQSKGSISPEPAPPEEQPTPPEESTPPEEPTLPEEPTPPEEPAPPEEPTPPEEPAPPKEPTSSEEPAPVDPPLPSPNDPSLNLEEDYLFKIDPDGPHEVHLNQLTLSRLVLRRRPVDIRSSFKKRDQFIRLFLNVRNFEHTQRLTVKWIHNEEVFLQSRVKVKESPRWRTWSTLSLKRIKKYGAWTVEVWSPKERLLGRKNFTLSRR